MSSTQTQVTRSPGPQRLQAAGMCPLEKMPSALQIQAQFQDNWLQGTTLQGVDVLHPGNNSFHLLSGFLISHDPVFSSANRNSQIHTITLLGIIVIIFHFKSPRCRQINLFKVTVDIELGSICLYSKKSSGKWSHKIMSWCVRDMHLQVKDMVQMTLLGSGPLCIHRKIGPAVGCLVLLSVFAESIVL